MHIEPPATIAILGAGPIGLEAALYARYLGYNVQLFERGEVAENVLAWGHIRMFSPFAMNASPLALAALAAQDESFQPPAVDALLTGKQWAQQYLLPLANSDLLVEGIYTQTRVLNVSRRDFHKGELIGDAARAASPFRLLVEDASGEREEFAEVVIDTTGTFGIANRLGPGGGPALGELKWRSKIEYGLPDIAGTAKSRYAGKRTLVVGSGYSAATNVIALAEVDRESSAKVTWLTKARDTESTIEPIPRVPDDRLPQREALAIQANQLASDNAVNHIAGASVTKVEYDEQTQSFEVELMIDGELQAQTFDEIIANVGYRGDSAIYDELQVHQCYASGGPMKLAAALLGETSADCLDQTSHGADMLRTSEPNFYIVGSKSYGRNSNFLVSVGLAQIRDVFSIIGDRENLDLYASIQISQ